MVFPGLILRLADKRHGEDAERKHGDTHADARGHAGFLIAASACSR